MASQSRAARKTKGEPAGRGAAPAPTPLSRARQEAPKARVTPRDALDLATRKWIHGERLDVGRLAKELGVSRATMFRWVGTREQLYGEVLYHIYSRHHQHLIDTASAQGLDLLESVARRNLHALSGSIPLRKFIEQDPEFAIRLLTSPNRQSQQHSVVCTERLLQKVVKTAGIRPQLDLHTLAHIIVRIGEAVLYANTIGGGSKPDIEKAVAAIRILVSAEAPAAKGPGAKKKSTADRPRSGRR